MCVCCVCSVLALIPWTTTLIWPWQRKTQCQWW